MWAGGKLRVRRVLPSIRGYTLMTFTQIDAQMDGSCRIEMLNSKKKMGYF